MPVSFGGWERAREGGGGRGGSSGRCDESGDFLFLFFKKVRVGVHDCETGFLFRVGVRLDGCSSSGWLRFFLRSV